MRLEFLRAIVLFAPFHSIPCASPFSYHLASMSTLLRVVAAVFLPCALQSPGCTYPTSATYDAAHGWGIYGSFQPTVRAETPEISPDALLAHADQFVGTGELLVLDGHVSEVCKTMGCWLEVRGREGSTVLVMNKDHAFFVPRNCRGREVHATGHAEWQVQTVEFLQHLAADAGKTSEEIALITEEVRRVVFIADSVIMPAQGLEEPAAPLPAETVAQPEVGGMTPTGASR